MGELGGNGPQFAVCLPPPKKMKVHLDRWDEKLVIVCYLYIKNCIFVHITKIFPGLAPLRRPLTPHKLQVLEPPLIL